MQRELTYDQLQMQVNDLQEALSNEKRKQSDAIYRLILESISDSVIITDSTGKIAYACPNTSIIFGISDKEIIDHRYIQKLMGGSIFDPADLSKLREINNIEWILNVSDDQKKVIVVNVKTVDLPIGSVLYVMRDITEYYNTRLKLKSIEKLNSAVLNQAPIGIATIDSFNSRFKEINQKYCDILGYSKADMLNLDFMDITHPDDLQEDLNNMARLRSGIIPSFQMQKRYFRQDGSIVWVDLTMVPLWENETERRFHIAMVEDITDLKLSEENYKKSEKRFQDIAEKIPGMLYQFILHEDGSHSVPYISPLFLDYTGIETEKIMENPSRLFEPIFPEDIDLVKAEIQRSAESLTEFTVEHRAKDKMGNTRWFHVTSTPTPLDNGDILWDGISIDITRRKQIEEESNRQRRLFETMFNAIPDGVVITNTHREILLANNGMKEKFGYEEEELLGKTTELLYANDKGYQQAGVHLFNEQPTIADGLYVTNYQDKNGREFPGETFGAKLYDENKQWIGNLGLIRDISGRLKLEAEKEAEHQQLISIFDGMDEPIYISDPETYELLYSNDAFNDIWGKHIHKKCYHVIQNRETPCPFCTNERILGDNFGRTHSWDYQNLSTNRWYHCIDRAIKWPDGRAVRFELAIDITEQRENEINLNKTRNSLESLWKITRIADKDIKTICDHVLIEILSFTESEYAFYGFIDEEQTCLELHSWSTDAIRDCEIRDREIHFPISEAGIWAEAVKKRKIITINDFNQKLLGTKGVPVGHVPLKRILVVPLEMDNKIVSLACLANKTGEYTKADEKQVLAFLGNVQLLIDRKKAELELLKTKTSLEEAQRIAKIGNFEWNLLENRIWCSDEFNKICGVEKKDGSPDPQYWFSNVHHEDKNVIEKALQDCYRTGKLSAHFRLVNDDTREVHAKGLMSFNEAGQPIKLVGTIKDVTEEKQLAIKLQQAQKMESLGTLAGGIAHDFNNILAPIIGISEFLLEDLPKNSQLYEDAENILQAGQRGGDLVKQILVFSRQTEHRMIPIRIQKVMIEVLKLIRATIPTNIEITSKLQQDCGLIEADPVQIHQVAMNIITNAYHAVEEQGGRIRIELKEAALKQEESPISSGKTKYASLSITDNGIGIPADKLKKIFDPYFTTKTEGKGTGLGLSVVYGIIQEHKGHINVESEVGKGTTFRMYLPLIAESVLKDGQDCQAEIQAGFESILLVDDEPMIVDLTERKLESYGYKVTSRIHSLEALKAFRGNPDRFDLIITDMAMPDLTGIQLAKEIRKINKKIPMLICTGFSDRINADEIEELGIGGILMKPIVGSELSSAVRKILDETEDDLEDR